MHQLGTAVAVCSFFPSAAAPGQLGTPVGEEWAGSRCWKEEPVYYRVLSSGEPQTTAAQSWNRAAVALWLPLYMDPLQTGGKGVYPHCWLRNQCLPLYAVLSIFTQGWDLLFGGTMEKFSFGPLLFTMQLYQTKHNCNALLSCKTS